MQKLKYFLLGSVTTMVGGYALGYIIGHYVDPEGLSKTMQDLYIKK